MTSPLLALVLAATPAVPVAVGPPLDMSRPPVHDVAMTVEVGPARDVLALLSAKPDAAEALKRLRASRAFALALSRDGGNPDDVLGRLVSVAAGAPDPLLSGYASRVDGFARVLDALEVDGTRGALIEARRIAALLPAGRRVTARLKVVPLVGLAGFDEVVAESDGETTWLFADLPRFVPDGGAEVVPREVVLSLLRAAAAESWKRLFAPFRTPPSWPEEKGPTFEALLTQTVAAGPETLFLFPDEFFPLGAMFEEPVKRSFSRWNAVAATLLSPETKEAERREALASVTARGDFWARHAAVVGVKLTETLLQRAGEAKTLEAFAAGPQAVARLYVEVTAKTKEPALGKEVRKALEPKPAS